MRYFQYKISLKKEKLRELYFEWINQDNYGGEFKFF